jgi:CPA2 family monovalent cation:H+ antiporter-2
MVSPHDFLSALTVVLCVAAVTTVTCQKLKLPVVLGYVIAGLIIGPHVPVPLVADTSLVTAISELGVILVMFSLGLEFSLSQLKRVGPTSGLTAIIETGIMFSLGFAVGRLLGWTTIESIFTGALVAISSTTIIVKTFDEQGVAGRLRELVVGVLIVEDLVAILLLATLTAISSGAGLSASALVGTLGRLAAFLAVLVGVGLLVVPRVARAVLKLGRPETTLVASVGFCFSIALLAQHFGYSVALGAFIAGSLVAESGEGKTIEHLVQPLRDLFAAIFFVSVGMLIDPAQVAAHWGAAVVLFFVVIIGKVFSVSLGSFLTGSGTRASVQAGMSLAQIGEFSFIIAALGKTLGATGDFLFPVAAAVSVVTSLSTGWMVKASGPVASFIDRKLPRPVQTFTTLYASWVEQLREAPAKPEGGPRRKVRSLIIDAVLFTVVVVVAVLSRRTEVTADFPLIIVVPAAVMAALPFLVGIVRMSLRLAAELAEGALPRRSDGKVDLAAAPRRVLLVTFQLVIVLALGIPMVVVLQPLLPSVPVALVLLLVLAGLGLAFWRSATNLEGHVRAGVEIISEALMSHSRGGKTQPPEQAVEEVGKLLPGLGLSAPSVVELAADSPAVGKTLAELNLRGVTGATVLAITRGQTGIIATATETLQKEDRLALAGSREAIDAARLVLGAH